MFDWMAKKVEEYTERRHAGEVTITWDQFANDTLIIEWVNEQSSKGIFSNQESTSSITIRVDREAIHRMRHFQELGAEAMGYKMPLPLGDFKVGLVEVNKDTDACMIRVRDCHGDEESFLILGNWIKITLPSNDVSSALVEHTEGE